MKKIILSLLLITISTVSFCKIWTITRSGYTFSPSAITITYGDSVNFDLTSFHHVVEVSKATWAANDSIPIIGFSVPLGGGMVLPTQLAVDTHYYVCQNHAYMGMKGIIIVQNSAGIRENTLKANISIYPNPSKGKFQLQINSLQFVKNYNLEIYNTQGDKIYAAFILNQQNTNNIDLSDLPKGIYFIKFNEGVDNFYNKIVIQ